MVHKSVEDVTASKDKKFVKEMVRKISRLETKYATPPNKRQGDYFTRKRPISDVVPHDFIEMYKHLATSKPKSVEVPCPFPTVNWAELRFKPSLPKPGPYPVYGVVQDPSFYKREGSQSGWVGPFYQPNPFGSLPGYRTNLGVVPVPTLPEGGYVWTDEEWVIHATWAGDDGPSSRRRSQPWRSGPRPPRRAQGG